MKPTDSISFSEFTPYDQEAWLKRSERDLKGRQLAELDWQLEEDWRLSPFWHAPAQTPPPLFNGRSHNNWQIGSIVEVTDDQAGNQRAFQQLMGGVQAPLFDLRQLANLNLSGLLEGIEARFVSLHFLSAAAKGTTVWEQLQVWAGQQSLQAEELRGSLTTTLNAETAREALHKWPHFRTLAVDGTVIFQQAASPVEELAQLIHAGAQTLEQMEAADMSPAQANQQLFFRVAIGRRYYLDIVKLRALRILWANVLGAYGLGETSLPPIHAFVHLDRDASMEDRMIHTGTQALAAVIGGADCLFIPPAAQGHEKRDFAQRIARNVQHLLQLESKLDQVVDPAAGSYFLERLTDELSERAWGRFVTLQEG